MLPGASGIGKAIAKRFAEEGASVVIADINEQSIQDTVKEIEELKGKVLGVKTDVSKLTDIEHLIQTTLDSFQTQDILVNNAGILDRLTPVTEVTDEFWDKIMSINLTAPMRLSREAIKIMVEKGKGNIINMSSLGGLNGGKAGTAYTASKHDIVGLTKNIAYYHAHQGIRCNAIAPGSIKTNFRD